MKYVILNLESKLYWDETCQLYRAGGFVPLYNTKQDALNVITKYALSNCIVDEVLCN